MRDSESESLVRLLSDSFDVMEREVEKVNAIAAEIELIASKGPVGSVQEVQARN
jgi:hypothetical protein